MIKALARSAGVLLIGAALAGCPPRTHGPRIPPSFAPTPCPEHGVCVIKVTVNDCQASGGIVVDKEFVSMRLPNNLRWEIVTAGFEFAANGIEFDPPNPQFEPRNSPRPNEFRLHNKKSANGDFYYFINVKGCRQADPWVRNTN
jgi:hypothetical protein